MFSETTMARTSRFLAKIGVISPLYQLIYSAQEIADMQVRGELIERQLIQKPRKVGRPLGSKNLTPRTRRYAKKLVKETGYKIKCGNIITNHRFDTFEEAFEFADWNYKGNLTNIDIIRGN